MGLKVRITIGVRFQAKDGVVLLPGLLLCRMYVRMLTSRKSMPGTEWEWRQRQADSDDSVAMLGAPQG